MRENGRSMVEMLGVLAIIGVLSVGAIAGYSKAMFKYKLNKQAEQLTTVFNAAAQYVGQFQFNNSLMNNITETFAKLNLIPDEMIRDKKNPTAFYDIFSNRMVIFVDGSQVRDPYANSLGVESSLKSENGVEVCRNVILTAKANSDILWHIETNHGTSIPYYGYNYCEENKKCIADLTLSNIDSMCRGTSSGNFTFRIWFK